jgi:hypothetical protein
MSSRYSPIGNSADANRAAEADPVAMQDQKPESRPVHSSCRISSIEVQLHSQTVRIIALRGEHDLATSRAIEIALATHGGQDILVDLCGASFIDSSVINTLLRSARAHAGSVELVAGHCSFPRRVLGLARIQQVVPIHGDLAAGLASMDARQVEQRVRREYAFGASARSTDA